MGNDRSIQHLTNLIQPIPGTTDCFNHGSFTRQNTSQHPELWLKKTGIIIAKLIQLRFSHLNDLLVINYLLAWQLINAASLHFACLNPT